MKPWPIVVSLCVFGLVGCKQDVPSVPPRPVLTITVRPVTHEIFGPFASTIEARYETQLGFQTSGRVVARKADVGDEVKKGQELALLDPTISQFALARSKADVADAKAQLTNAQGEESRKTILMKTGDTSQVALDAATAGLQTAEANLQQKMAALHVAEEQLGYTTLHANFDGIITAWSAEVGQYVSGGQGVVKIARPDPREAVVDIPDDEINRVRPDMWFDVRLLVAPQMTTKARVREIGPLADSITRTHRVRLTLENPAPSFRIGTTITVALNRAIAPKLLIPPRSIGEDGKHKYVWVLTENDKAVSRRDVTVDGREGDLVVIGSGLAAGDRVVTLGIHSLHEGEAVAGSVDKDAAPAESTHL